MSETSGGTSLHEVVRTYLGREHGNPSTAFAPGDLHDGKCRECGGTGVHYLPNGTVKRCACYWEGLFNRVTQNAGFPDRFTRRSLSTLRDPKLQIWLYEPTGEYIRRTAAKNMFYGTDKGVPTKEPKTFPAYRQIKLESDVLSFLRRSVQTTATEMRDGKESHVHNFLFCGGEGSGKTLAACGMAQEIAWKLICGGRTGRHRLAHAKYMRLKTYMDLVMVRRSRSGSTDMQERAWRDISSLLGSGSEPAHILVLDDVGSESSAKGNADAGEFSPWSPELWDLLAQRANARLCTLLVTDLTMPDLFDLYGPSVVTQIHENYVIVHMKTDTRWREEIAHERASTVNRPGTETGEEMSTRVDQSPGGAPVGTPPDV